MAFCDNADGLAPAVCLRGSALQPFLIEHFSWLQCFGHLTYAEQFEAVITCAEMLYLVPQQMDVLDVMFPEDFQRCPPQLARTL